MSISKCRVNFALCLCWCLLLPGCLRRSEPAAEPVSISKLLEKAGDNTSTSRVKIRALVTEVDKRSQSIYLEDASGAIKARTPRDGRVPSPGEYVEVEAIVAGNEFSPTLVDPVFRHLT